MIKFKSITKYFGNIKVFENVNFEIHPGECVAITGESGSGKTTLINILIGSEKATQGSVEIDHFCIENLNRDDLQIFRRHIGVIFQDFKLLPSKTVCENIVFVLEAIDKTDQEIELAANYMLRKVGMLSKKNKFPNELSGGEKQRVAIARALSHNPKLIIADEPTGNLDHRNSMEVIRLLNNINQDGITVIISTHSKQVLNSLKPRIIRLEKGRAIVNAPISIKEKEKVRYSRKI